MTLEYKYTLRLIPYEKLAYTSNTTFYYEITISKPGYTQVLILFKEDIENYESLEKVFKGHLFFSEDEGADNCARSGTLPYNYINIRKTPYYKEIKRNKKQIFESLLQQKNVALVKWSL